MLEEHDRLQDDGAAYAVGVLDPSGRGASKRIFTSAERARPVSASTVPSSTFCRERCRRPRRRPGPWPPYSVEARRRRLAAGTLARRSPRKRERWRSARLGPLGWVAAAGVVGLVGWNLALHHQFADRGTPVAIEQLAHLPDGRIVALIGTGTPQASARLYVTEDGRRGELAVTGLPALPPGRVYQLWFARPGGPPLSGGVFHVDDRGQALTVVVVPVALDPVRAIAVTEEPAPGSPAPTGAHLLDRRI